MPKTRLEYEYERLAKRDIKKILNDISAREHIMLLENIANIVEEITMQKD